MQGAIQKATQNKTATAAKSVNQIVNSILDGEAMRRRFDDLLGKRAPQFISSLVSLVNATPQLQQAMYEAPMTVIQSALKAATYDLPIDASLGYAYIVPFRNKQPDGSSPATRRPSFSDTRECISWLCAPAPTRLSMCWMSGKESFKATTG